MATLKIGSIGSGRRGGICKLAHRPDEGVELAAICDPKPQVIEAYRNEFGDQLRIAESWRQMLDWDDIDAVFITTPDYLHEQMAIAALQRGKSVYLEKPMAITIEGCDRILAAAKENDALVYVGHNMRFFPVILKMKQWIDEGRIGQVQAIWCRHFIDYGGDAYFKDWHSEQQYTNSLLLQKGAHDIDVIHFLAGSHTARTVGMGKLSVYNQVADRRPADEVTDVKMEQANWPPLSQKRLSPVIDVEDHNMMLMQMANGVQASYCQCHYTPDGWRNYTIIGTEGRIENTGDHSDASNWAQVRLWNARSANACLAGNCTESIPPLEGTHGGSDPQIVSAFIEYLRTGKQTGATAVDARWAVAAGCQAAASIRSGNQPMDIPDLPTGLSGHSSIA